MIILLLVLK